MSKTHTIKIEVSPMHRAMIYMVRNEEVPEDLIIQFMDQDQQAELRTYNTELRTQHWHVWERGPHKGVVHDMAFGTEKESDEFENLLWHWYGGEEASEQDKMPDVQSFRCVKSNCRVYVG